MKNFFCLFILTCLWLSGKSSAEESMKIQSGEATYNGTEISLIGNVVVEHQLGTIKARRLTVLPKTYPHKKMMFSFLKMEEDIQLDLKEGGQFRCQSGEIDEKELKGTFKGNATDPQVVYIDPCLNKHAKEASIPIEIQSLQMQVQLGRPTSQLVIQTVQAQGQVKVYYNRDFTIQADQIEYQPIHPQVSLKGILKASSESNPCTITHRIGDQIQSHSILVDTLKGELICYEAQGVLCIPSNHQFCQMIHFSSEKLIWNDKEQVLTLQGHVHVYQAGIGDLKTEHEMRIYRKQVHSQKETPFLISPQDTQLTYTDEKKKLVHQILCYGSFTLDHHNGQLIMQSPVNEKGDVVKGKQVYFEDPMGDLYADQVHLHYSHQEHTFTPTQLILSGHVKILNRFNGHVQESSSVLHYALADHVEYQPLSKEMALSSQNGKRVLFLDKVRGLQMSAPSLKIKRAIGDQKDSIQGIGDVRFTFMKQESQSFHEHFLQE
jgi:lipopolysaccharide export system protein LptA